MGKNITINTKKMAIIFAALNGAGLNTSTLLTYFLDLVLGGPKHDWGNAISTEIRKIADRMVKDPVGLSLDVAVDVATTALVFQLAGMLVTALGGKKSIQIAPGVTWRFL